jgi:hypothetical protein
MARAKEHREAPGSALVDPEARRKLEAAAAAAGLTMAQLVDLVHDSGAMALPPDAPDGITTTLTLGDLGLRLWGELQQVVAGDRTEWFGRLLESQKIALIVALADRGIRPELIARDLNLPSTQVRAVLDQYADRIGAQVTQVRLSTIAGHVQLAAERAMEGLRQEGDWKGYFGVQKDVVKILQSLGIVDQAIHRVEVTHKMEDNTQAEIEAMLELERKKDRRKIEISAATTATLDAVPQLEFEREE